MTHYIRSQPIPTIYSSLKSSINRQIVKPQDLPYMPKYYSGITYTPEYSQPYVVWFNGLICIYAKSEREAITAYRAIERGEKKWPN